MVRTPTTFSELIYFFIGFINQLIPIVMSLSLLVFVWGIVLFINKADNPKTHAQGRQLMIWGIVGLFVMMSYIAIISFFYQDLGFGIFPGLGKTNHFLPQ